MDITLSRGKRIILLLGIFVIALLFRTVKLNKVYVTSDDLLFIFEAMRIIKRSLFSFSVSNNFFVGIIGFPLGFTITFLVINIAILNALHVPLTEIAMRFPLSLFGALTCFPVYYLVKELTKKERIAYFSSLFIAVGYFHIFESRFPGRMQMVIPLFFSLSGVYYLMQFYNTRKCNYAWAASLCIGLYLVGSLVHPAIIALIFFISFLYCAENQISFWGKVKATLRGVFSKELVIIPLLFYSLYVIAALYTIFVRKSYSAGFLGHIMGKREVVAIGFYLPQLIRYLVVNFGTWLSWIMVIGVVYGAYCLINLKKQSILFVWFLIYTLPFILFSKRIDNYLLEPVIPLILLSWMGIFEACDTLVARYHFKILRILISFILTVAVLFTVVATLGVVFKVHLFQKICPEVDGNGGSILPDTGIKTAGYYIRKYIASDRKIFTDFEPCISNLYFNRVKMYAQFDATLEQNLDYFIRIKDKVDVAVINAKDAHLYVARFGYHSLFSLAATVVNNQQPLVNIYVKMQSYAQPVILDVKKYNSLFNQEFTALNQIMPKDIAYPPAIAPLD